MDLHIIPRQTLGVTLYFINIRFKGFSRAKQMDLWTILWILAALILLYVVLRWAFSSNSALTSAVNNAQTMTTISASSLPSNTSSNFTYSIWFYVNDWNYQYGKSKVIFGRMASATASGGAGPCPVVTLDAMSNNVSIAVDCFAPASDKVSTSKTITHTCSLANIPIQRWVHLAISVNGRTLDAYLDGKLVNTCLMPGTSSVAATSNIYVTPNGGFSGYTSSLQFWPNPLNTEEIWGIYRKGYNGASVWYGLGVPHVQLQLVNNGISVGSMTI